jgi:hypothetical protein
MLTCTAQDHCRRQVLLPIQPAQSRDARRKRKWRAHRFDTDASTAQEETREEAHVYGGSKRAVPLVEVQDLEVFA